jgi:hypothetical protein
LQRRINNARTNFFDSRKNAQRDAKIRKSNATDTTWRQSSSFLFCDFSCRFAAINIELKLRWSNRQVAMGSRCIMWNVRIEKLAGGRALKYAIELDESPIGFNEVLRRWQNDPEFRSIFNGCLADAPFSAFRWENPPMTTAMANGQFEFVLLDSPGLACRPDAGAFAEHFRGAARSDVVEFPNLGGDAIMVVPCPISEDSAYGHLAAFVRLAPEAQRHSLWKAVGAAMLRRLGTRPVWLSTAGAGVSWLHVRLDDRPKYYGHAAYRDMPA